MTTKKSELAALLEALKEHEPKPSPSFSWGNIVNSITVPVATGIIVFAVQWGITSAAMTRNAEDIKLEKIERDKQMAQEKADRDKLREQFLSSLRDQGQTQSKLVEVLGKLDTRMSVAEKQQESTSRQLEKLGDMFAPASSSRPRR